MIDYLSHPKFLAYNPAILPSAQGGGGGMGTKTFRAIEALKQVYPKTQTICNAADITADTVLIEPLRFTMPTDDYNDRPYETVDQLLEGLHASPSKKVLYCSELALMRMNPAIRTQLIACCDLITTNCKFQAQVFKYAGVYSDHLLCDPVPDVFIPQVNYNTRETRIVATGNISWQKNAQQVIEVFKALKGIVKRVYIGSGNLWFDATADPIVQNLQETLYANCDDVVREATTTQVVNTFHHSRFGLWVAFHDVFATAAQEMIMSGMPIVTARHGLASEIPVCNVSGVTEQVKAIKHLLTQDDDSLTQQSQALTKWSKDNVSYTAFHAQLKNILTTLW